MSFKGALTTTFAVAIYGGIAWFGYALFFTDRIFSGTKIETDGGSTSEQSSLAPDATSFDVFLTAYSFWDNTPPASAAIAFPVIHTQAGGIGTYDDPITIAVGHKIENGVQTLDYPVGTLFYVKRLKKYAIVEDVCGDGQQPQFGPCHIGYRGYPWLDIYQGGEGGAASQTVKCARRVTGIQPIIMEPPNNLPVAEGDIFTSVCADIKSTGIE